MKKCLRVLILALVLVFTCSFCLTACDNKSSGSTTLANNVEKKYLPELADIYLSVMGMDSSNEGYAEARAQVSTGFGSMMTKEIKTAINYIGDKILTPAGCTDKVISKFIGSTKDFAIASINFNKVVAEKFGDNYGALVEDGKTISGIAMGVIADTESALGAIPYIRESIVTAMMDVAEKIDTLDAEGQAAVLEAMKALLDGYNGFIGAIDGQVLAGVVLNFATTDFEKLMAKVMPAIEGMFVVDGFEEDSDDYNDEENYGYEYKAPVLNDDLTTIGALEEEEEEGDMFAFIGEIAKAIGLNDKKVKNAYKTVLGIQIDQTLRALSFEKIDYDHIVDLLTYATADNEDQEETVVLTNIIAKAETILDDIGAQISYCAYTETEVNDFISACNTLNKSGLGYFAERVIPAERYMVDFAGHFVSSISIVKLLPLGQDFEHAGVGELVENIKTIFDLMEAMGDEAGSVPVDSDMVMQLVQSLVGPIIEPENDGTNNAIIKIVGMVNDAFNGYANKAKFVAALNKAFGADLVTTYIDTFDGISKMDLVDYEQGEPNPEPAGDGQVEEQVPDTALTRLVNLVMASEVDVQGYIDAYEQVANYFAPIVQMLATIFVQY